MKATYNLKAVVHETGLKPDTLRAWERRYGLPKPERTSGGHRIYSQRDIDLLKWLVARQQEGLNISHAVALFNEIEEGGEDPLESPSYGQRRQPVPAPPVGLGNNLAALRHAWLEACKAFDEHKAEKILAEAFSLFPTETVCFELLQQGLAEVGLGWYEGRVTVQQEHFTSALAIRRLETMVASTPPPTRSGRIMAVCPPEERHTFGLLLLTLLLRRNGWDVIYLGASVPQQRLEATLEAARPQMVVMSAQTLYTASLMLPMVMLLQQEQIPAAFGGAVFTQIPKVRERLPAYYLGDRIEDIPQVVDRLMTAPLPPITYEQADVAHRVALQHFVDRQPAIAAHVWDILSESSQAMYIKNANSDLGQNIIAALTFGDMNFLTANLEWIEGLLVNYHYRMPKQLLHQYISAYHQAAIKELDERGALVINWLGEALSEPIS